VKAEKLKSRRNLNIIVVKKAVLLINVLCLLKLSLLNAQTNQGKVLLGVSSTFSLAGSGPNIMSLGYTTTKLKSNAGGFTEPDPDKTINLNFLPKAGYFVIDNLAVGLDITIALSDSRSTESGYKLTSNSTLFSIGPFVRYYVPAGRVLPFFELGAAWGSATSKFSYDNMSDDSKANVSGIGGGIGLAIPLGNVASFDVLADYNSLTVKNKEDNPDNTRTVSGTLGLKLGFVLFLGRNK